MTLLEFANGKEQVEVVWCYDFRDGKGMIDFSTQIVNPKAYPDYEIIDVLGENKVRIYDID